MKRIAYKLEMHCQHFKKAPSKKQSEMAKLAQSKKANKPLTMQVRNKKTRCPSHLNEHVFNIPKNYFAVPRNQRVGVEQTLQEVQWFPDLAVRV